MSWSVSEAMTDPAIKEPMSFRSEFKFRLRDLPTEITLRLYNPFHSNRIVVRRSHQITIPGLHRQASAACEDETQDGDVLQSVVSEFVCNYNAAVAKGLKPQASWLQPDPNFR
jgi:hypothetical protein